VIQVAVSVMLGASGGAGAPGFVESDVTGAFDFSAFVPLALCAGVTLDSCAPAGKARATQTTDTINTEERLRIGSIPGDGCPSELSVPA
jgi:hypothetical protein